MQCIPRCNSIFMLHSNSMRGRGVREISESAVMGDNSVYFPAALLYLRMIDTDDRYGFIILFIQLPRELFSMMLKLL